MNTIPLRLLAIESEELKGYVITLLRYGYNKVIVDLVVDYAIEQGKSIDTYTRPLIYGWATQYVRSIMDQGEKNNPKLGYYY